MCWDKERATMKMLVCGGRNYDDVPWMWFNLDRIGNERKVDCVIDGAQSKFDPERGMVGADYWAHQWALVRGRKCDRYPADWDSEGTSAGPRRNKRMIDEGRPNLVVAFPGGKGTADMTQQARDAGIEVIEIQKRK
jgi:hypothetical protein